MPRHEGLRQDGVAGYDAEFDVLSSVVRGVVATRIHYDALYDDAFRLMKKK
jgi:hypothetical protein